MTPEPAFLDPAQAIGQQICGDAVWYGGRCNWVGATREEGPGGVPRLAHVALGADLYGGTSGVAVFLAHLFAATGEDATRRGCLGAIRHSLHAVEQGRLAGVAGLYTGPLGVALAAVLVGRALGDGGLVERGAALAGCGEAFAGNDFDLLSGRAGSLLGLLILGQLLGDPHLRDGAVRLGEELLALAVPGPTGLSWATSGFPTLANLTGFSHGAAGAAFALLELHAATGDPRYSAAAAEAIRYEQALYDPVQGNWPDLRAHAGQPAGAPPPFATFWCHGAPGIAVSRLLAAQHLGPAYAPQASQALQTTAEAARAALPSLVGNFSLCHGHAGNAEILLAGSSLARGPDFAEVAMALAEAGARRFCPGGEPWPCGTYASSTPGMLLGLAGIGLFYLRLAGCDAPSMVMPSPEGAGYS